jgi:hypothetical protein
MRWVLIAPRNGAIAARNRVRQSDWGQGSFNSNIGVGEGADMKIWHLGLAALSAALFASPVYAEKAALLGAGELITSSHASDGTDRAKGTSRRFTGQMGASAVSYKGWQYVVYYSGKDRSQPKVEQYAEVFVARRKLGTWNWQRAKVAGYRLTSEDAHNRASIAVSQGDGRLHITFDHHNAPQMNYAMTARGVADNPDAAAWNDATFTYTKNFGWSDFKKEVTYPSFVKSGKGDLLLYFRDGGSYGGEMQKIRYDAKSGEWEKEITRISSENGSWNGKNRTRGPYLASGVQMGLKGSLHIAWLFREMECKDRDPAGNELFCNHGLYYAKSLDGGRTWRRADNSVVADTAKGEAISIDNIGNPVVPLPYELAPSNPGQTSAFDHKTGNFHVLISHLATPNDSDSRKTFHYIGTPKGKWRGKPSSFALGGVDLEFVGDRLFAFGAGRESPAIYYATRKDGFATWRPIDLPPLPGAPMGGVPQKGFSQWDTSNIDQGNVSLVWHAPALSGKEGDSSPVWVADYKITFAN